MPLTLKPDYKPAFIVAFIAAYLTGCLSFCLSVIVDWNSHDDLFFIVGMAAIFAFMPTAIAGLFMLVLLASFRLLRPWYFAMAGAALPWIVIFVMFRRINEGSLSMAIVTLGGAVAGLVFWRISRRALIESTSQTLGDTEWSSPKK